MATVIKHVLALTLTLDTSQNAMMVHQVSRVITASGNSQYPIYDALKIESIKNLAI